MHSGVFAGLLVSVILTAIYNSCHKCKIQQNVILSFTVTVVLPIKVFAHISLHTIMADQTRLLSCSSQFQALAVSMKLRKYLE